MADFPDLFVPLIPALATVVTPVDVGTRVPVPRPTKHLQLRRQGGGKLPPVRERVRFDLMARAATEPEAMALLLQARSYINGLHGTSTLGIPVYRVEESMGPRQDDDDLTHTPMAWMTFSLLIRADAAIR